MASWLLWLVLLAVLTINRHDCEDVADKNPQKMVEIIELMLSQRPNESDKKGFGIQKVPQEDAPNYEILITPNKNSQEVKGSQKIKIFVEASNFDAEDKGLRQKRVEESEKREKQNIFDVLPLSIETVGLNIKRYQQSDLPVVKLNDQEESDYPLQKDFESYHNKRQTSWGVTQKGRSNSEPRAQEDVKRVGIQPGYVDQNNPYHPATVPKKEERPRVPTYDGDYSSSSQNGKRITQQTYVEVYNPEEIARPRPSAKEPARNYDGTYEETRPSRQAEERRPVYSRPDEEARPSRQAEERRPVYSRPDEEARPSRGTEERRPAYGRQDENYRPSGIRNPSYDEERRPNYEREETRPSGDRRPYNREPANSRPEDDTYSDYERERPGSGRRPTYTREPSETERERRPIYEKESGGGRYEDDNAGYSGFPESHQTDINNHYSRPLQSEPPRVFPASPCLNVFKYEGREPQEDRWYANISVSTDEILIGVRLDIRLDRPAEILTNWLSEVTTVDSIHFTILSLTHKLVPGPPETVRIMVKFNGKKPVPYLKSINLNGRLICPSNRVQKTTTRSPVYENPGDLQQNTRRTTERYQEGTRRPVNFVNEFETNTKRSTGYTERYNKHTTPHEQTNRKTTPRTPPEYVRPNPNGYDETDLNSFAPSTKKPPGRPAHSNGKPPSHAAKPAQGVKPGNGQSHGQGHGHNSNKHTGTSTGNRPSPTLPEVQGFHEQKRIPCGTPSVQPSPLITHGQLTSRGQWPWHVALYKMVGPDLSFFCGGSLINNNYVLTAAHCVTKSYTRIPLDDNDLIVYLGIYHRSLWGEGGAQNRKVSKIYIHPKYNSSDFKADIAVLALSNPVEFTDYIRPICLWDKSHTNIEEVEGKEGTVVGWGYDEMKKLTEELRQAKMPVVPQRTCLLSYPEFYLQFSSNLTYCAGFRNGTSVCNGDSGGGMVFPHRDASGVERWHLRGIVSISPARNDTRVCDLTHYVVFTDVAQFLPWLDSFV